ncbi:hypothetical protein BD310DRAFT_940954 [Dichomitus squalens]|uniref:Uncharacterized protein n=1 Tax=Dichomitus squalens TaxID=114155 RepID=A0A4Q9PBK2_9APHY|nr:hypothetical protein BD310DRAFT_940954 [Dichomitus squalens]
MQARLASLRQLLSCKTTGSRSRTASGFPSVSSWTPRRALIGRPSYPSYTSVLGPPLFHRAYLSSWADRRLHRARLDPLDAPSLPPRAPIF